ncbi:MAG: hypothetical protein ACE15C_01170 [Phycisphaerae bacterium]
MPFGHEEHREFSTAAAWIILAAVCLAILGWGLLNYALIPDAPRQWNSGALEDVPAESVYSNAPASASQPAPPQVQRLPEASTKYGGGQ